MVRKLSYKKFLESLQLSPRLVVELVIEGSDGGVLLIKREHVPFKGHYHLPGTFLLKGESIEACAKRISEEELEYNLKGVGEFVGLFENIKGDSRGHILHYVLKFEGESVKGKYFIKLPKSTIWYQKDILKTLGY